ncbi:MAG TPA: hypothetical protein VFD00_10460 [Thermoclostridium sp.]|nr:hypothetical protein [Thermoclostridium sp.]
MTRAKNNLTTHYNGNYLDNIRVGDLEMMYDETIYLKQGKLQL